MSLPEPPQPPPVQKKLLPQEFFEFIIKFDKPLTPEEKCAWIGEAAYRVLHGELPQELFVPLRDHIEALPTAIPLMERPVEKIPGSDYVHDSSKPLNPLLRENPTFISDDLQTAKRKIHRQSRASDTPLVLLVLIFVVFPLCLVGYGISSWYMNSPLQKKENEVAAIAEPVIQEVVAPALVQEPAAQASVFTAEEQAEIDKFCAEHGKDVKATTTNGRTLLHVAAREGHAAIAKFLVSEGADVNARDNDGAAPINLAAWGGYAEIVKFLLSKGADVNARNNKGGLTPLHLAAQGGQREHVETVRHLVSGKADVHAKSNTGATPLHEAARYGRTEIAKFLVSQGADVRAKNNDGKTPLDLAKEREKTAVVEYLTSLSPVPTFTAAEQTEIDKFLAEFGGDVKAADSEGRTSLHQAADRGRIAVVKYLVSKGADVNAKTRWDRTPLQYATRQGQIEVVKYLVSEGADVNAKSNTGDTPLHRAADTGDLEVVKFIVSKGGNVNVKNNAGKAPLDLAKEKGHTAVAEYLTSISQAP